MPTVDSLIVLARVLYHAESQLLQLQINKTINKTFFSKAIYTKGYSC